MTNSSTHTANAFGNQDAISLQDFDRVIHSACENEYRSRAKLQPYREVRVLCFHFDTDQFEAGTYCDKIKIVFSQGFGFRVAASILPSKTFAQRDMLTALEEAFDGMDSDCLVIIYYIGRGEVRHQLGDAQLWMQGRQQINEQTPGINFNTVRETAIDHQPAKVLMLLLQNHPAVKFLGFEVHTTCMGRQNCPKT